MKGNGVVSPRESRARVRKIADTVAQIPQIETRIKSAVPIPMHSSFHECPPLALRERPFTCFYSWEGFKDDRKETRHMAALRNSAPSAGPSSSDRRKLAARLPAHSYKNDSHISGRLFVGQVNLPLSDPGSGSRASHRPSDEKLHRDPR